jgi:[ribosomal protein S5]-alanine N-acetyltransferase
MNDNMLITDRLILRRFTTGDTKSCFENWGNDETTGKYFPFLPVASVANLEQLINMYSENEYMWAVVEKSSENVIGNVSINIPYEALQIGELAYLLGSKWYGKGYATEAVTAVLQYMFVYKDLHLIEAKYNENNSPSAKLLKKLGFQYDGTLRDRRIDKYTGERNALVICSIIRNEFFHML